jgi:hypothetical protein
VLVRVYDLHGAMIGKIILFVKSNPSRGILIFRRAASVS